jgi:Bacterial regulatory proteins, tetR family
VKTKAQVMHYLKGSFTSLHRAAAALNENNMDDPMPSKGNRTRLLMLIDAVVHSSNHYGQMFEYLRMNHIVPPASRWTKRTMTGLNGEKMHNTSIALTVTTLFAVLLTTVIGPSESAGAIGSFLDRADVGRATFYSHFKSKDELLISGAHDLGNTLNSAANRTNDAVTWVLWRQVTPVAAILASSDPLQKGYGTQVTAQTLQA